MKILAWKENDDILIQILEKDFDFYDFIDKHNVSKRAYKYLNGYDSDELTCLIMVDYFKEHKNSDGLLVCSEIENDKIVDKIYEIDGAYALLLKEDIDMRYSDTWEYYVNSCGGIENIRDA